MAFLSRFSFVWQSLVMQACIGLIAPWLHLGGVASANGASAEWGALVQNVLTEQQRSLAAQGAHGLPRFEIVLGQLDSRLKLAPCQRVNAYMPEGAKLWGRTRVGLRCEQGLRRWNVYWPVTVKAWGSGLVMVNVVEAGQAIQAEDVAVAEVDLAQDASPAVLAVNEVSGRTAQRRLAVGQSLRQSDLKARRWFSAGDTIKLILKGQGFVASAEGVAMAHGDEGRCARVRTAQGKVVCAFPTAEGVAELSL